MGGVAVLDPAFWERSFSRCSLARASISCSDIACIWSSSFCTAVGDGGGFGWEVLEVEEAGFGVGGTWVGSVDMVWGVTGDGTMVGVFVAGSTGGDVDSELAFGPCVARSCCAFWSVSLFLVLSSPEDVRGPSPALLLLDLLLRLDLPPSLLCLPC